jgi:FMN phosphatase YigB (HAD superfamily)
MVGNVMNGIRNIIFDLGGVIINLDFNATARKFENLGIDDFDKVFSKLSQSSLVDQFDKGLINENYFFNTIKNQFELKVPLHELEKAWNAMLLDFPKHRMDALKKYKEKYRTF